MASESSGTTDSHPPWGDETLDEALSVLRDLVLWELTPQRWDQVRQLVGRIAAALAAGNPDGLRAAVGDLDRNGPVRALRIGGSQVEGVPEPVLDRCNELVHALVAARSGAVTGDESAAQPAQGVDGASATA